MPRRPRTRAQPLQPVRQARISLSHAFSEDPGGLYPLADLMACLVFARSFMYTSGHYFLATAIPPGVDCAIGAMVFMTHRGRYGVGVVVSQRVTANGTYKYRILYCDKHSETATAGLVLAGMNYFDSAAQDPNLSQDSVFRGSVRYAKYLAEQWAVLAAARAVQGQPGVLP